VRRLELCLLRPTSHALVRDVVFDKFYRVQRPESIGGTGLGLSICKGIVEAHGGFIAAENRLGGGTTITVALPLKEPPASRPG